MLTASGAEASTGSSSFVVADSGTPSCLFTKDADLFGLLFGVSNFAQFAPLFAGRDIPHDCNDNTRARFDEFSHHLYGVTWASYPELNAIDWSLASEGTDLRDAGSATPRRVTREQAREGTEWETLMRLMAVVASRYGEDNVRLIVFFD